MQKKRVLKSVFWGMSVPALVFGFVLMGCGSSPQAAAPDLTGVATYYVRANGNDKNAGISEQKPFKTLDRAIEAASGSAVKTITVIGTLTAALPNITKGTGTAEILITGRADAAAKDMAVLQIPKEGEAFVVGGDSRIRFEHVTITGGTRGGIEVNEGATVTLGQGAAVSGNSRKYGGGIQVDKGTLILCGNALVTKNKANSGGGIAVLGSGTVLMRDDALVSENETATTSEYKDGEGGGVYAEGAEITMGGNAAVVKNKGYWGGGIYANAKSVMVMRDSASVRENTLRYDAPKGRTHIGGTGGGVYMRGSLTMRDTSTVSGNVAAFGGGVFVEENGALVMEDRSAVKGNTANTGTESDGKLFGGSGGGVRIEGGRLAMKGESSLDDNTGFFGGGLSTSGTASVVLEGSASIRNNSIMRNNEKQYGGSGGGVLLWGDLVAKDDAVLANNSAYMGGGAYVAEDGTLTLQDRAAIQRNEAVRNNYGGNGGGAVIEGTVTVRGEAQVSGNTALYGGGLDLYGKLILEGTAKVTGNTASQDGGGVYINKGGAITGDQSLISGNKADEGADIYTEEE